MKAIPDVVKGFILDWHKFMVFENKDLGLANLTNQAKSSHGHKSAREAIHSFLNKEKIIFKPMSHEIGKNQYDVNNTRIDLYLDKIEDKYVQYMRQLAVEISRSINRIEKNRLLENQISDSTENALRTLFLSLHSYSNAKNPDDKYELLIELKTRIEKFLILLYYNDAEIENLDHNAKFSSFLSCQLLNANNACMLMEDMKILR